MPSQRVFLHVLAALLGCIYALASSHRYSCALTSVKITYNQSRYTPPVQATPPPLAFRRTTRTEARGRMGSSQRMLLHVLAAPKFQITFLPLGRRYSCASVSVPIAGVRTPYTCPSPPTYTPSPLVFRSTRTPEARGRAKSSQRVLPHAPAASQDLIVPLPPATGTSAPAPLSLFTPLSATPNARQTLAREIRAHFSGHIRRPCA